MLMSPIEGEGNKEGVVRSDPICYNLMLLGETNIVSLSLVFIFVTLVTTCYSCI
jgi:hypothetical protein